LAGEWREIEKCKADDWKTYGIDFEIPLVPRTVEVDLDFLMLQAKLIQRNVDAMGIGTAVEGVESNLGVVAGHDVTF
jgi:hypothetical protein